VRGGVVEEGPMSNNHLEEGYSAFVPLGRARWSTIGAFTIQSRSSIEGKRLCADLLSPAG